jgi:SAUR family protein
MHVISCASSTTQGKHHQLISHARCSLQHLYIKHIYYQFADHHNFNNESSKDPLENLFFLNPMAIGQMLRRSLSGERRSPSEVPKGHVAVYVGENDKTRFVIPVSYLNQPLFQELLYQAEQEYGFDHPMGGLTIPCNHDFFLEVTSRLGGL